MVIKETKINLSLQRRCKILDINRASYYKWLKADYYYDDTIDKLIVEIFNKHKGTYGRKRITLALQLQG